MGPDFSNLVSAPVLGNGLAQIRRLLLCLEKSLISSLPSHFVERVAMCDACLATVKDATYTLIAFEILTVVLNDLPLNRVETVDSVIDVSNFDFELGSIPHVDEMSPAFLLQPFEKFDGLARLLLLGVKSLGKFLWFSHAFSGK